MSLLWKGGREGGSTFRGLCPQTEDELVATLEGITKCQGGGREKFSWFFVCLFVLIKVLLF